MTTRGRRRSRVVAAVLVALGSLGGSAWFILANRPVDPLSAASQAYGRGDWAAADAEGRRILNERPTDREASRIVARTSARLGKDELSESIYRRLGAGSMKAEDLFLLGRGLLRRGVSGPALASLKAARDADPDHAETLLELARYWEFRGSWFEAVEAAGRLSERPGWEIEGHLALGRTLPRIGDPDGASRSLADALRRDPTLVGTGMEPRDARRLLAANLLAGSKPDEAEKSIGGDDAPESAWLMSRVFLQRGQAREAEASLARAGGPDRRDPMDREPSPYAGSASCGACHRAKLEAQQSSRHSRTLLRGAELAGLPWPATVPDGEARHEFRRSGDRVEVTTRVGPREHRATIEYALGSNHQGQSFVARDEVGRAREFRISRYPCEPEWDRTIEHPVRPPDESGYLGRTLAPSSVLLCLDCHSTDFRAASEPAGRPEAADRGIGCERCHGPGANHLKAAELKISDLAIARPRLASPARVMELCGECHKAPGSVSPDDPKFIRFQTPNLERSRCYTEGGGTLTCVTCHDPHVDTVRTSKSYEAKCLDCHRADRGFSPGSSKPAASTTCRVNPADHCLDCHMPRVTDAVPRSVFTDHFIRVRDPVGSSK